MNVCVARVTPVLGIKLPLFISGTRNKTKSGNETVIYANFQGKNPNEEDVDINVRRECFWPQATNVNYITFSGFTVNKAATTWAPPAAFQDGMVGPHWAKGVDH